MNELTCSAPSIYSRDGRGNACKCKGKKAHLVVVVEYKSKYNRRGATDTKAAVEHSVTCHCDPARTPESPLSSCPHAEMGIKGLMPLIAEHAPHAIKEHEIKTLFGRKVAIDASMSMYQFLIAVRQKDGELLTNDAGETTSHLMGFFYRTIRIVEHGLKPAYVFDGKPPDLKKGVVSLSLFLAAFLFYELKTPLSLPSDMRDVVKPKKARKRPRKLVLLRTSSGFRVVKSRSHASTTKSVGVSSHSWASLLLSCVPYFLKFRPTSNLSGTL